MYRRRTGAVGFLVLVASLAFIALVGGAEKVSSSPGPTMRLSPSLVEVEGLGGEAFSIDVLIEDVTNLGAFEFELQFDDSIANLDIKLGPFLGSEGAKVICFDNVVAGGALGCIISTPALAPSGSGVVAQLNFTLKLPFAGTSQLALQRCLAADPNGIPISLNGCKDGSFVVPAPPSVGGVSVDSHLTALTLETTNRDSSPWGVAVGMVAVACLVAMGAGAWYTRRRV